METEKVFLDDIVVGDRLRPVSDDKVTMLAESMKALGLQTPITVWTPDNAKVFLVAGAHRLAAAKRLGWEDIACTFVNMDEIDRRLWEIAENLHRADLIALEKDEHAAEWIRLTEQKLATAAAPRRSDERDRSDGTGRSREEKPAQLGPVSKGGRGNTGGINAAVKELGIKRSSAQRAIKVAGLSKEAKNAAKAMSLDDNRSALLAAAKHEEPDEQVAELRRKAEARIARKTRTNGEVKDAMADAGEIIADAIAEFVPEGRLSAVTAALALRGLKDVAARVQSLTGAVFDKTPAGHEMRRAS